MVKNGKKLLEKLREAFENRPRGRDGMLYYLERVYVAVWNERGNASFYAAVKARLLRSPQKSCPFAEVIEVTSTFGSAARSKYARVLRAAFRKKIDAGNFRRFVKRHHGFNGVISGQGNQPATTRSFSPLTIAGQRYRLDSKKLQKAASANGKGKIIIPYTWGKTKGVCPAAPKIRPASSKPAGLRAPNLLAGLPTKPKSVLP